MNNQISDKDKRILKQNPTWDDRNKSDDNNNKPSTDASVITSFKHNENRNNHSMGYEPRQAGKF